VAAAADRQAGLLRLGYTPLALQAVLPGLLADFRAQDHDARVDLLEMPGPVQPGALASGRVDLAFSDEPFPPGAHGNLLLHRQRLSLLVPAAHPLAARASITLDEIGADPLILHPRHEYPAYYDRVLAACAAAGLSPDVREREAGQNCMGLVMGGAGLLLTSASCDHSQPPGLQRVRVESSPPLHAEVWAAWAEEHPAGRAGTLVKIIQAQTMWGRGHSAPACLFPPASG